MEADLYADDSSPPQRPTVDAYVPAYSHLTDNTNSFHISHYKTTWDY